MNKIDLNNCKSGDILISIRGRRYEYLKKINIGHLLYDVYYELYHSIYKTKIKDSIFLCDDFGIVQKRTSDYIIKIKIKHKDE